MQPSLRLVGLAAVAALPGFASASPYIQPDMEAATSWELKVEAQYTKSGSTKVTEGPALDITAPIVPGLEASVVFGRGKISGEKWGDLDAEAAMKWEIVPVGEEDGHWGVTIEPAVTIPTGTHGFGGGEYALTVPVVVGAHWGPFGLHGTVGYGHGFKSNDNIVPFGLLALYDLTEKFSVGVEYAAEAPTKQTWHDYTSSANLGFSYALAEKVELQGRIGHSLRTAGGDSSNQVALFVNFGF